MSEYGTEQTCKAGIDRCVYMEKKFELKRIGMNEIEAIKEFKPVEHRIEFIREIDGVKWYNDSASSSPTRTLSGINAFKENIVLIAGGYDKNLDYEPLGKPILEKVDNLVYSVLSYMTEILPNPTFPRSRAGLWPEGGT